MSSILHDNIIEGVTPIVGVNEVIGFEAINITDWALYTAWKPGVTGIQDLKFDMGSPITADTFAIYGHNLGSEGCSLKISHSTTDSSYNFAIDTFVVQNDGVLYLPFPSVSRQFWRIRIEECTIDAVISVVAIGVATVLPKRMPLQFRPPLWGDFKSNVSLSREGVFLGRSIVTAPIKTMIIQNNVSEAFVRGDWKTFIDHARVLPFFFSWDEDNHADEGLYCWSDPTIKHPRHTSGLLLSAELPIQGLRL